MRFQKSGCDWVVVVKGEAVGEALAIVAFNGDAEATGFGVGDPLAAGVAAGVEAAWGIVEVTADAPLLLEFRFD
jgi:hypothetical protein